MVGTNGSAAYADIDTGVAIALMRNRFSPDFTAIARLDDIVAKAYPPPAGSPQPGHKSGTGDGNTRSVRMAFDTTSGPPSCSLSAQRESLPSPRAASATPDIASEAPDATYDADQIEGDRMERSRTNPASRLPRQQPSGSQQDVTGSPATRQIRGAGAPAQRVVRVAAHVDDPDDPHVAIGIVGSSAAPAIASGGGSPGTGDRHDRGADAADRSLWAEVGRAGSPPRVAW